MTQTKTELPAWKDVKSGTIIVDRDARLWKLTTTTISGDGFIRRRCEPVAHDGEPFVIGGLAGDPFGWEIIPLTCTSCESLGREVEAVAWHMRPMVSQVMARRRDHTGGGGGVMVVVGAVPAGEAVVALCRDHLAGRHEWCRPGECDCPPEC